MKTFREMGLIRYCLLGFIPLLIFSWEPLFAQTKSMDLLSVGSYADLSSFDPHAASTTDMDQHLVNVYVPLVGISDEDPNQFKPVLAESWSISADGLPYIYHLRKGVEFTDGTDFNATAAKFNFDRFLTSLEGKRILSPER